MARYRYYQPEQTFWSTYGRFLRWMMYIACALGAMVTLVILLAPEVGWQRLQDMGICAGIYLVIMTPILFFYRNKEDY